MHGKCVASQIKTGVGSNQSGYSTCGLQLEAHTAAILTLTTVCATRQHKLHVALDVYSTCVSHTLPFHYLNHNHNMCCLSSAAPALRKRSLTPPLLPRHGTRQKGREAFSSTPPEKSYHTAEGESALLASLTSHGTRQKGREALASPLQKLRNSRNLFHLWSLCRAQGASLALCLP